MTGNADRSMGWAARIGEVIGFVFIALGIVLIFSGAVLNGLWIIFLGWFLTQAAAERYREAKALPFLRRLHVGDLMSSDYPAVDGHEDIQQFVDEDMLRNGKQCFPVEQDGAFAGLITPGEIAQVNREKWPSTMLSVVMRPAKRLRTVTPETSLKDALEIMANNNVNQLPVIMNGHLRGLISRNQILQLFQTRAALHV
jgi:CBS domain-containing protein